MPTKEHIGTDKEQKQNQPHPQSEYVGNKGTLVF